MRFNHIVVVLAVACLASVAQADVHLQFKLQNGVTSGEPFWTLLPSVADQDPNVRYSVRSPHLHFGCNLHLGGGGNLYSALYDSFTDLRPDADGTWTMTLTSYDQGQPVTSVYHIGVSLDLAPVQMVPRSLPIVPAPGEVLSSNPTFSWPGGLDFVGGVAEIYGDLDTVISTNLAPGTTSWSPGPLPDGDFSFMLHLFGPAYNYPLPITYELVSGPDLGAVDLTLNYVMNVQASFSVPEPASILSAIATVVCFRRWRRMQRRLN